MKTYLTHKNQIEGFKDVAAMVKTIEKIAAASVHFLEQEVANLIVFSAELEKVLARLSLFYQNEDNPLLNQKKTDKKMLIILTGDKGLVGGLWHEIISLFLDKRLQYQSIVVVGAKGKNYLEEEDVVVIKSFSELSEIPTEEEIGKITDYIFAEFKKGALSKVDVLYPNFISLAEQQAVFVQFLPFEFKLEEKEEGLLGFPVFEPSKKMIFNEILQKYIQTSFYRIMMETKLSELSARTVSMEHASTKADEFIKNSTLNYIKDRRRFITQKQLESFTAHKTI